ncbi:class I SAM-dependent methyltransferase [Sphingomonas quercus]|uniref:Methyltransferase n=1 Tax=Sphingomonas quercus TaxID=2842451 RepID=A0ABS6BGL5_9SPHN|nr:methyltransferase [Sphingomonas quercus]MBU3077438.1 methyltransferase [Sphingomonas quercus]
MRRSLIALLMLTATASAAPALAQAPANVTTALAAPSRAKDATEDARRHPAEILTFAEVKQGQTVADLVPGGGYWTRIFSGAVGPRGHVYSVWPDTMAGAGKPGEARVKALGEEKMANNEQLVVPFGAFALPKPADVIFTSQNIHDFPNPGFGSLDLTAFGKQVLAALKPGGRFIVIDHAGAPGTGQTQTGTLHRIEAAHVRQALETAGFRYAGASNALANAEDDHTLRVFDPVLRGHTDQFVMAFVKPR